MRSILFLLLSIISFSAFSQTPPKINLRSGSAVTISDARLRAGLNFYLPHQHGLHLNGGLDSLGGTFYDDSSQAVWYRDTVLTGGHQWTSLMNNAINGLSKTGTSVKLGGTITETTTLTGSATDKRITISSYAGIGNAVLEVINNNSSLGSQFGWAFKASSVTNAPAIYGVSGSGNGVIGASTSGAGVYGGSSIGSGVTAYVGDTLGTPLYIDHRPTNTGSGNKVYNSLLILRESGGPTVSSGIGSRIAWIMAGRDGSGNPAGLYPMIGGIEVKENIIGGPTMQSEMSLMAQGDSVIRKIGIFNGSGYVKFPFYGLGNITGTATYNLGVTSDGKVVETTNPVVTSGDWNPIATGGTNTFSVLIDGGRYTRIGNVVTFSLRLIVTTTLGNTESTATADLPVPSDFGSNNGAAGTNSGTNGSVETDATSDVLVFKWISQAGGGEQILTITGQYTIN